MEGAVDFAISEPHSLIRSVPMTAEQGVAVELVGARVTEACLKASLLLEWRYNPAF